ncbi:NhaC family Na+:H+ antiporter [Salirhabdus euzebyi]|uniref:NhaC family Na+:H+ antiporter n=1 Tax=Salirhabdus euzebyi TaxID=394506 RepID=A0A841Q4K4_9BACI|nr:Na+/H+ antiporter NhaC family protein [Salirhabdus euzebyi]MBB6453282.1 NhaC family Na+:H+ antiporter [Salirhabdus euzebyi]
MKKAFSLLEIILIFSITITFLMIAISSDLPLYLAMLPGLFVLCGISWKHGYTMKDFRIFAWKGIKRNGNVAWLLFFIGMLLPTWYFSGTIDDVNTLFLSLISPNYFFMIAFLVTAMMSMIVGSTIASLSIVGVPLMAAAAQLGLPLPVVAGALVSGGFVGDRSSPISSSFQLLRNAVELETREHFRVILPTMLWGILVSTILFLVLDVSISKPELSLEGHMTLQELPLGSLAVSLVPPFLLLMMILLRQEMKLSFSVAIGVAVVILLARGTEASEWTTGLYYGVESLSGVQDMLPFVLFILIVGAYCQIMEDTNIVQPYINKIFTEQHSLSKNTSKSIGIAGAVSLISPNQSFPIILTGRALFPFWNKYFSKEHLARILADSTVVFAGLVPWSLLAILCSTIVGVPVLMYAPFAMFLLVMPVVTWIYSVVGWKRLSVQKAKEV